MFSIANTLKNTAATGAFAFALCFAVTPASAMNGAEFSKACAKKSNCVPAGGTDGGYIVHDDGSFTVVTCTKTNCTASKQDRQIRFGDTPGNDRMSSGRKESTGAKRLPTKHYDAVETGPLKKTSKEKPPRIVAPQFVVHPQISTQKPDVPKVQAPASNVGVKNIKVNPVR
jgi:hypothetical protein